MDPINASIVAYTSLSAYYILHMIFVISSDFVDAFNIPPLNIGIYVVKLMSFRALLIVIADIIEWQSTKTDGPNTQKKLIGGGGISINRICSILGFLAMFGCRIWYLVIIYKSDNKSLYVFVTLCIEGFWFGVFQMSFFAIGPEFNAFNSLGIYTMGNFIFFFHLILNNLAKDNPKINSLYRVRAHGWICLITSVIGLCLWIYFCLQVTASVDSKPSQWPNKNDVLSPLLLFPVGSAAKDFLYPAILPFAFLDNEKANLVNYLVPAFLFYGALVVVLLNDFLHPGGFAKSLKLDSLFKEWSEGEAPGWHYVWLLNVPIYIAFFIAMFGIHGTVPKLRCIVQSRWRIMLLTIFVIIPRSILEVAGYVGVANYAIGRADQKLASFASLIHGLQTYGSITSTQSLTAENLKNAIGDGTGDTVSKIVRSAIIEVIQNEYRIYGIDQSMVSATNIFSLGTVIVTISSTKEFGVLCNTLADKVKSKLEMGYNLTDSTQIPNKLATALNEVKTKILTLLQAAFPQIRSVEVSNNGNKIEVKINGQGNETIGNAAEVYVETGRGSASTIKIEVKGQSTDLGDNPGKVKEKGTRIAKWVAAALVSEKVKAEVKEKGYRDITAQGTEIVTVDGEEKEVNGGVKLQVKVHRSLVLHMNDTTAKKKVADKIRGKIIEAARDASRGRKVEPNIKMKIGVEEKDTVGQDFEAFAFIAVNDILAKFCIFFNGKLSVGYNLTRISVGYCLPEFKPRHKGLGFWFWFGRSISGALADIVKDFKADIKDYL